jgi:hypothetical protein
LCRDTENMTGSTMRALRHLVKISVTTEAPAPRSRQATTRGVFVSNNPMRPWAMVAIRFPAKDLGDVLKRSGGRGLS